MDGFFVGIDDFLDRNVGFRVFTEAGTSYQSGYVPIDDYGPFDPPGPEVVASGYGDTYDITELDRARTTPGYVPRNVNNDGTAATQISQFDDPLNGLANFAESIGRVVNVFRSPNEETAIAANRAVQQRLGIPSNSRSADQSGGAVVTGGNVGKYVMYAALAAGAFLLLKKVR